LFTTSVIAALVNVFHYDQLGFSDLLVYSLVALEIGGGVSFVIFLVTSYQLSESGEVCLSGDWERFANIAARSMWWEVVALQGLLGGLLLRVLTDMAFFFIAVHDMKKPQKCPFEWSPWVCMLFVVGFGCFVINPGSVAYEANPVPRHCSNFNF